MQSLCVCNTNNCTRESGGFGDDDWRASGKSEGELSFKTGTPFDARAAIDELSILLTAGRLSPSHRNIIVASYKRFLDKRDGVSPEKAALKQALKLFLMSSSFHSTNLDQTTGATRRHAPGVVSRGRPFKALVVLFLVGGGDSFNLLVCIGFDICSRVRFLIPCVF